MPARLTYPGVYVQEKSSGVRTIAAAPTSRALFLGMAKKGQIGKLFAVRNYEQYEQNFGDHFLYGEMAAQVQQFFINGGSDAVIVRIANAATAATVTLKTAAGSETGGVADSLVISAKDEGDLGNQIRVRVDYNTAAPELTFNMEVFRLVVDAFGVEQETENEFIGELSMDPAHPRFVKNVVDNQSALINVDSAVTTAPTSHGYSQSALMLDDDEPTALGQISALLGGPGKLSLVVDGGQQVVASVPQTAADLATWLTELSTSINNALISLGQSGSVVVTAPSFDSGTAATGRCIRITSLAGSGVMVWPTAQNNAALPLQLGAEAGGIEISAYTQFRPAPTGFVTRLSTSTGAGFSDSSDLDQLIAFASATRSSLANWTLTDSSAESPFSGTSGFTSGDNFLQGPVSSAGIGSLQNVRSHIDTLVGSINSKLKGYWIAQRHGFRISLKPQYGSSNAGVEALLVSSGGFNMGDAAQWAAFAQSQNTATYSLGSSGTSRRQDTGVGGSNGLAPEIDDYLDALAKVEREKFVNLVVLPLGDGQSYAKQAELWGPVSAWCQRARAFLLVDPPSDSASSDNWKDVSVIEQNIANLRLGVQTDHAAVYWPRIKIGKRSEPIAPSGTVAGTFARTDTRRGVWKAPAGIEAKTLGVTGFEHLLTDGENGVTNPVAVNALRQFDIGGVVWGARTMAGSDNSGSEYGYVPVRRTALLIEESLYRGLKFAVFQPNDEDLWAQVSVAAGAFMNNLFRQGAFQGSKAADAYEVRCDESTTTQNDINLGQLNVVVSFAPLKPAEFVVLTVRQMAGQVQV